MNKWKKRIIIVIIALVLNVLGRYVAYISNCPAYLNICGTILAAYFEGPVVGLITAMISCGLSCIFSHSDWAFLIADVAVAVAAGLIAKKNRYFERFALIISATAFLAVVRTPFLLIINLSVNGGKSGLVIADGIVDFLNRLNSPLWLQYTVTALYISFTDCLTAVFTIFLALFIHRSYKKKRRQRSLKRRWEERLLSV